MGWGARHAVTLTIPGTIKKFLTELASKVIDMKCDNKLNEKIGKFLFSDQIDGTLTKSVFENEKTGK